MLETVRTEKWPNPTTRLMEGNKVKPEMNRQSVLVSGVRPLAYDSAKFAVLAATLPIADRARLAQQSFGLGSEVDPCMGQRSTRDEPNMA
jgi:hypothetical protein